MIDCWGGGGSGNIRFMFQKGTINDIKNKLESTQKGSIVKVGDYHWTET